MFRLKLFFGSLFLTAVVLLGFIYINRPKPATATQLPVLTQVANGVFVTSQLKPENLPLLKLRGIKTIVDERPDGEASNQSSSAEIERAAKHSGLDFYFIPISHETIPERAVDELDKVLSREAMPVLLYCRTGRRAVRTFALVQASRTDGPSREAIFKMVRVAGFSVDDLNEEITNRIAQREDSQIVRK